MKAMRAPWIAACALLALTACWDRMAGNGSEVENAVAGTVRDPDGGGAVGVRVGLYPSAYDPLSGRGAVYAVTDGDGRYSFPVDTGTFNIYASEAGTGRAFLEQGVRITGPGRWDAGADTLRPTGHIHVTLPPGSWKGAYVCLPGTPLAVPVDAAADAAREIVLDSVPAGSFAVVLARPADTARRVVGESLPVFSGSTSDLPYSDWKRSAIVRIDHAALGGDLSTDVTGAPLLLRLDAGNFDFASASALGADLRVTGDAGGPLPIRVQEWDSANSSALVWVRADTVFGGERATRLRLYWGNPEVTYKRGDVFPSSDGYAGAWHFDAPPRGTPPGFGDESGAGDSLFALGSLITADTAAAGDSVTAVTRADGVAGRGLRLNGKDAALLAAKTYAGPSEFTYTFWFKTTTRQGGKILGFVAPGIHGSIPGRTGNFNFDRVTWMDNDGFIRFGFTIATTDSTSVGTWQAFVSARAYNDGEWHHLACSASGARALLSIDGETVVDYTGPMRPLPNPGYWRAGYVGDGMWDPMWTSEYFRGSLDEVRILHSARGEDWLRVQYATQKPGSRVLVFDLP